MAFGSITHGLVRSSERISEMGGKLSSPDPLLWYTITPRCTLRARDRRTKALTYFSRSMNQGRHTWMCACLFSFFSLFFAPPPSTPTLLSFNFIRFFNHGNKCGNKTSEYWIMIIDIMILMVEIGHCLMQRKEHRKMLVHVFEDIIL